MNQYFVFAYESEFDDQIDEFDRIFIGLSTRILEPGFRQSGVLSVRTLIAGSSQLPMPYSRYRAVFFFNHLAYEACRQNGLSLTSLGQVEELPQGCGMRYNFPI